MNICVIIVASDVSDEYCSYWIYPFRSTLIGIIGINVATMADIDVPLLQLHSLCSASSMPSLWQSLNVPNSLTQTGAVYGLRTLCAAAQNHPQMIWRGKATAASFKENILKRLLPISMLCISMYTIVYLLLQWFCKVQVFVLDKSISATYRDDYSMTPTVAKQPTDSLRQWTPSLCQVDRAKPAKSAKCKGSVSGFKQ